MKRCRTILFSGGLDLGREDVAVCHWQGEVAEVRLHLDGKALTLRGEMRASIARMAMQEVALCDEGVRVSTAQGDLLMEFAPVEAGRWQKALLKKPPTLAEKLGVSGDAPGYVLGRFDDQPLSDALSGAVVDDVDQAALIIAIVLEEPDLKAAADLAQAHAAKHVWMIYRKGKAAVVGDAAIRAHMRGAGFVDSKSSAVSDQFTATRYRLR